LMPKNGTRELQLNDAQRRALIASSKIAVSLEPIGGSPTGHATGPILFIADIAPLAS
jgi:anti-sigma-K factor RskA